MSKLENIYEMLPVEIKNVLSYYHMHYFIFNGPTIPACIKQYLAAHREISLESMAVSMVVTLRTIVIEKGIATEQDLDKEHASISNELMNLIKCN